MARKDTATDTTDQEIADLKGGPVATIDPDYSRTLDITDESPTLSDGHDEIVEEAPDLGPTTDMLPPEGDPGDLDLSAFGGSTMLPDDLGIGDDSGLGGPVDAGTDLGDPLDDLAGDLSDPSDGYDGMSDGSGPPELDDQSGWAMDDVDENDRILAATSAAEFEEASETMISEAIDAYEEGDDIWGDFLAEASAAAEDARQEIVAAEDLQSGSGPRDETMPGPDDGTSGDPDASDFIGGRGDVDPAPETEDHGGEGGLDIVAAGLGAVDPLDGESTLLGGDTGDLAEMAAEADLGDVEIELDDALVEADIGEDV